MAPFSKTHGYHRLPVWKKLPLVLITFVAVGVIRQGTDNLFCQAYEQECANDDQVENRPKAQVILNGKTILIESPESPFNKRYDTYPPPPSSLLSSLSSLESTETQDNQEGARLAYYILQEEKPVLYVPNFLNASITEELKGFCITDGRFQRSPIRGTTGKDTEQREEDHATGKTVEQHETRTR
jgi:hypothetical protein